MCIVTNVEDVIEFIGLAYRNLSNSRVHSHSGSRSFRNRVEISSSLKAVMEEGSRGASLQHRQRQ
jgi:hypothetical protein